MSDQILVSKKRLKYLEDRDRMLSHLEAQGVDNWDGYSSPPINIIVNGVEVSTQEEELDWESVVCIAGKQCDRLWTITYQNAFPNRSGEMSMDDYITIQDGTIFNVVDTSKA